MNPSEYNRRSTVWLTAITAFHGNALRETNVNQFLNRFLKIIIWTLSFLLACNLIIPANCSVTCRANQKLYEEIPPATINITLLIGHFLLGGES